LPTGDHRDVDLEIDGVTCIVGAGVYVYRNVNIWGGGTLQFEDAKIDFHARSILVENGGTLEAGVVDPIENPVSIWLYGRQSAPTTESITCKSSATCGVPEALWASNPNVPNQTMPGMNDKCTPASNFDPDSPVGTDCFYQYENLDQDDKNNQDGHYFGRKVLAVSYGGTMILRGAKGILQETATTAAPSDSGSSWVRLKGDVAAGAPSFYVDRPVPTWTQGDQIVLTSTDYLPSHSEQLEIASVTSDNTGTKITLMGGTTYPHSGTAYDLAGLPSDTGPEDDENGPPASPSKDKTLPTRHLETRAAVALLTRTIMIASEGDEPTLGPDVKRYEHFQSGYYGGHTVVRQGFKQYQIQGVEFFQLGQGGIIGKYPIHFHMSRKVPQPNAAKSFDGTYVVDSSIHDSNTRFITVHATQGVLLARNVGYRSIGHGFYLEDATEINNKLYSNIGIQARAAIYDDMNPRNIPGIFARPGDAGVEVFPYHSDWDHPSVFWIMNTWNDMQYNVAVGAGTCGACYWMPPAAISGSSVYETWDSYAAMQTTSRTGAAPLLNFVGNSCSTAMNSLETIGATDPCLGVTYQSGEAQPNTLYAIENNSPTPYPNLNTGQREKPTLCSAGQDCSKVPLCDSYDTNKNCAATVISHYTTSFNWASKNFAAVWLRGWWYLMHDSALTDIQSGGFTAVTGGGYTRSDISLGFWNLSLRNAYVGHTQANTKPCNANDYTTMVPQNAAASNAGPFNPCALTCPYNGDHCVSKADGISIPVDSFANAQRLFNIYDGPVFEDRDAYADINVTKIGTLGECKKPVNGNDNAGACQSLGWENGYQTGVLQDPPTNQVGNDCYLPNAAIAWKQPNGFYYPPAFRSTGLAFKNVDIRHYVVEPLWTGGGFDTNFPAVKNTYCSWEPGMFGANFTAIDRQTELSDESATLTGLTSETINPSVQGDPTISINSDPFFKAPLYTPECSSAYPPGDQNGVNQPNATADTSPYEYVTSVVYPDCSTGGGCADWGGSCSTQGCYGVPLYRGYYIDSGPDKEDPTKPAEIRMMGQNSLQRSNLTLNHARYYIDTTVPASQQNVGNRNVFKANQTYYVFFLYATPSLHQTYTMYLGNVDEATAKDAVVPARVKVPSLAFTLIKGASGDWIVDKTYHSDTKLLDITIDLKNEQTEFDKDRAQFCKPASYCSVQNGVCGCTAGSGCVSADKVCAWGQRDIDCPIDGCIGFAVTMPSVFVANGQPTPPNAIPFSSDSYFARDNVQFKLGDPQTAGCTYSGPPVQP
jgi:G8 domain